MNPFVISIFFMLFSFDTAWQKSGGGQCPPGPPGFDATELIPYYSCLSFSRILASFPIRTLLDPIHPFTRDRKCSDPKVSTFESEPKSVRIADPKVYGYAWSRVNARPIRTHIYPDSFGSDQARRQLNWNGGAWIANI